MINAVDELLLLPCLGEVGVALLIQAGNDMLEAVDRVLLDGVAQRLVERQRGTVR